MTEKRQEMCEVVDEPVLPVSSETGRRMVTRRAALAAALFAGALNVREATAAVGCECLPAPNCNAVCPNGGTPRGDGTQACDCIADPCTPQDQLAAVAYTGKYEDLVDKPDLSGELPSVVTAGSAGPTGDVTMTRTSPHGQTGSISIPYFSVDSKGRITAYGNRTFKMQTTTYNNYSNYSAYSAYNAYQNYTAYGNYRNYSAYSNYYDYNCCGDSDSA